MRWVRAASTPLAPFMLRPRFCDQGFATKVLRPRFYNQGEALSSKVTHSGAGRGLGAVSHSVSCDIIERTRASGSRPTHLPRVNAAQGASWVLGARSLICSPTAAARG